MRKSVLTFAAISACALSTGCVSPMMGAAASLGVVAMQDRTAGQALDDATASQEIKTRLMVADHAGFAEVDVEVADGSVLLSGVAPTEQHRQTAEMVARNVRSVHAVYDEIFVGPRSGFVRSRQDDLITAEVRARLVASPSVRGVNVNIEVFNGNVYLMGLARTDNELRRAAEITSTTPGVKRVVSFMQIEAPRQQPYYASSGPAPVQTYPQQPEPELREPMTLGAPQQTASSY
jgi:osmotically-inducible protein OsmY